MAPHRIKYCLLFLILVCLACKHQYEFPGLEKSNYPKEVGVIILGKCATSGCHNSTSYHAAANLNLSTWEDMFKGANSGSVAIPYRPDYSTLCFFTNTDSSLGIALQPTMPLNAPPLTVAEYKILNDWIAAGAPNANGDIKFADNPQRKKIYVANRMCDVVTVFDAASFLQMRYVDAGNKPGKEFPYCIKVSPDKQHWYVSFFSQSEVVQKFDGYTDKLVGEINLGKGSWTSFTITKDSKYGYFVDNSNPGKIAYADLENRKLLATYAFNGQLQYPIGIVLNEISGSMYIGSSYGNFIYRIQLSNTGSPVMKEMPLDGSNHIKYESSINPVELLADDATNNFFIACAGSNEIIVWNMAMDKVGTRIALGNLPAFIAISSSQRKLLVSCPDDPVFGAGHRGAVVVIDLINNTILKKINTGYQPYGIAIDEDAKTATVANANISEHGPSSHHASRCGAKNGNVSFINLNTLEMIPATKREVAVYPFGVAGN